MSAEPRSSGRKRKKPIKAGGEGDSDRDGSVSPHHGWAPPVHHSSHSKLAASSSSNQLHGAVLPAFMTENGAGGGSGGVGSLVFESSGSAGTPIIPAPQKKKGRASNASKAAAAAAAVNVPALLAPDYTLNPAGPASSSTTSFKCPQPGCGKIYKGKHARSIWRRHLQDKHGIPLSAQPRRTRWDNDANRPKSEEERRARTLDSKRRWARKNRAERGGTAGTGRSADGDGDGDFDEEDFEEGEGEGDWEDDASQHQSEVPLAARQTRGNGVSTMNYAKDEEYEEDDDLQTSYPMPSNGDRYPLLHRDANSSLNSSTSSYTPAYGANPAQLINVNYNVQPHGRSGSGGFYPPPPAGTIYSSNPSSLPALPPLPSPIPVTTPVSPSFTSLSTVAGRAALVPSSAFARDPYSIPESKEGAALLLALKRPSSPPSPAVASHSNRNSSHFHDRDTEHDGDTSVESADVTFGGFSGRSNTNTSEGDNNPTPPSETEDLKPREEDIAALQSRALKRVPVLTTTVESNIRDSEASLVRTPRTQVTRITMESSPAFKRGQNDTRDDDDDDDDVSDDEEDAEQTRRYLRGGRSSSSISSHRISRNRATRPTLGESSRAGSKTRTGVTSEVDEFGLTSPDAPSSRDHNRRRSYANEMLPPHSGSSSSISSFNLSTPAPSRDSYRPFFPSSASTGDFFSSSSSSYPQHSRAPRGLSSPPVPPSSSAFSMMFSSPAHPGVSQQLGLTAQPGPGVFSAAGETPGRRDSEGDERGGWNGKPLPPIKSFDR